jgi:hypothetical protein
MNGLLSRRIYRVLPVLVLMLILVFALQPAQGNVSVSASSSGFGAAFGYAQTIGPISYAQAGTIGNATADASAWTAVSDAFAWAGSNGIAASFAQAMGTPFGSASFVQVASLAGSAHAMAGAAP